MYFLGRELEGPLAVSLEGLGEGIINGATRRRQSVAREDLRMEIFERGITLLNRKITKGLGSWKERDTLSTVFLLLSPGSYLSLSKPVLAEALATLLAMPCRVCMERLG